MTERGRPITGMTPENHPRLLKGIPADRVVPDFAHGLFRCSKKVGLRSRCRAQLAQTWWTVYRRAFPVLHEVTLADLDAFVERWMTAVRTPEGSRAEAEVAWRAQG